jgi:CopG-like RHH_1 or ribbon-helix-helix domain, RHH_5
VAKRSVVKGVAYVGAVVPEELAEKVEFLALRTHRSVSDVIRLLIASAVVADTSDIRVTSLVGATDGSLPAGHQP